MPCLGSELTQEPGTVISETVISETPIGPVNEEERRPVGAAFGGGGAMGGGGFGGGVQVGSLAVLEASAPWL